MEKQLSVESTCANGISVLNRIYLFRIKFIGLLFLFLMTASHMFAQGSEYEISGTVTDEDEEPLPGVNILIKGTSEGVSTNVSGEFKLVLPSLQDTLVVSYIGYKSQNVPIAGRTELQIVLEPDVFLGEEMVVTGYGEQKKATVTGSIASVATEQLTQSPVANVTNALAGRLPGLFANQYSGGEPGVDGSNINVRGFSSLYNQDPIVFVDGVERDFSYLDPDEIESITILKDASATAAYGIRGANGVIVVKTKRGRVQEPQVTFKTSFGVNNPVHFPEYLGSAQYAQLYNEAVLNNNPNADPSTLNLFSQEAIDKFSRAKGDNSDGLGYNQDYFDYAFKPGTQSKYSLSINGGSDVARYYVFANYFSQGGNYTNTDLDQYNSQAVFKRYNFRSNIDIDITDNFYAKLDLGARVTNRNAPGTTAARIVNMANTLPPHYPIVLPETGNESNQQFFAENPDGLLFASPTHRFNILGELSRTGYLEEKNTRLNGSFTLGYNLNFIAEGLEAEAMYSYDYSNGRWINRVVDTYSEGYKDFPGYATFRPAQGVDVYMTPGYYEGAYVSENKYTQDQPIGNGFDRNPDVGRSYIQARLMYANTFGKHDFSSMILANRSNRNVNNELAYKYQGVNARFTYGYDERYLLEFNMGYNGSENFAPGNRYGFFPAISGGWVITNEEFIPEISWLNNLKLRGSYGLVGSDQIPGRRFPYLQFFQGGSDFSFGENDFGTGAGGGLEEGDLANLDLTWEKARKVNIGIDALLFNNQLMITADAFYEHRYDIILDLGRSDRLGASAIVGQDAAYVNGGIINNKGIDFSIEWNGNIGSNFSYYIRPNFSFARNQTKYLREIPYEHEYRAAEGKPLDSHFVYIFDRFVRDQEEADELNAMNNGAGYQPWEPLGPGDVVYKDLDGDGEITDLGDRKAIGYPRTPEIQFGIPIGIQYKNFDLSALFQGATNTSLQLSGPAVYDFPLFSDDKIGKVKPMHLNRWTPETAETATYPALHIGNHTNNNNSVSNLFLYDAKYIRLKTVEVGYNLPANFLQPTGFSSVRIYAQGLNLFTWDGLDEVDVDPETRQGPGDWYPVQRIITAGITVNF